MTESQENPVTLDNSVARARISRQRNLVVAGLLVAWVVLIYAVSIVRMG